MMAGRGLPLAAAATFAGLRRLAQLGAGFPLGHLLSRHRARNRARRRETCPRGDLGGGFCSL